MLNCISLGEPPCPYCSKPCRDYSGCWIQQYAAMIRARQGNPLRIEKLIDEMVSNPTINDINYIRWLRRAVEIAAPKHLEALDRLTILL
jgi:hypothetical protein